MNTPVALEKFIYGATTVVCNSMEIDSISEDTRNDNPVLHLKCGKDFVATVWALTPTVLHADGECTVLDVDGDEVDFEFRISRPMAHADL